MDTLIAFSRLSTSRLGFLLFAMPMPIFNQMIQLWMYINGFWITNSHLPYNTLVFWLRWNEKKLQQQRRKITTKSEENELICVIRIGLPVYLWLFKFNVLAFACTIRNLYDIIWKLQLQFMCNAWCKRKTINLCGKMARNRWYVWLKSMVELYKRQALQQYTKDSFNCNVNSIRDMPHHKTMNCRTFKHTFDDF